MTKKKKEETPKVVKEVAEEVIEKAAEEVADAPEVPEEEAGEVSVKILGATVKGIVTDLGGRKTLTTKEGVTYDV